MFTGEESGIAVSVIHAALGPLTTEHRTCVQCMYVATVLSSSTAVIARSSAAKPPESRVPVDGYPPDMIFPSTDTFIFYCAVDCSGTCQTALLGDTQRGGQHRHLAGYMSLIRAARIQQR